MDDKKDKASVLVVDDEELVGELAARVLKREGYRVEYVLTAEEALSKVTAEGCDVVLADIHLPRMDGMTLTHRIKATVPSCDLIVMTGAPTLENAIEAIKAGAYDFLIKPFSPELLTVTIERCYEKRRLSMELQTEKSLRAELSAAYSQLKSLERMKDAFLSTVGHELRTPLTPIMGGLEIVSKSADRKIPQELFTGMKAGAVRLKEVIDDLLFYAAIRKEAEPASLESFDLNEVARQVSGEFREKIKKAGLRLETGFSREPARVKGSREMICSALRHLVVNAIMFNKPDGKITMTVSSDSSSAKVSVEDTGAGIPPEQFQSIYDPFYQVADYLTRKTGGLGLGLAIIKQVAESHKGKVEVESVPGKGSIFTLVLSRIS